MNAIATHPFERCEHPGRHGYTQPGEPEHEMCERCRQPRGDRAHPADALDPTLVTDAVRQLLELLSDPNTSDGFAEDTILVARTRDGFRVEARRNLARPSSSGQTTEYFQYAIFCADGQLVADGRDV